MTRDKRHTAYCGLYCADCIPSDKKLFTTIKELQRQLEQLQFDEYAKVKSETNEVFKDYPRFAEVLREIGRLESFAPCREGCKPDCNIRGCVLNKNYEGCWECDGYNNCELLRRLKTIHPCLEHHLKLIGERGPENWSSKRGKHYSWQ